MSRPYHRGVTVYVPCCAARSGTATHIHGPPSARDRCTVSGLVNSTRSPTAIVCVMVQAPSWLGLAPSRSLPRWGTSLSGYAWSLTSARGNTLRRSQATLWDAPERVVNWRVTARRLARPAPSGNRMRCTNRHALGDRGLSRPANHGRRRGQRVKGPCVHSPSRVRLASRADTPVRPLSRPTTGIPHPNATGRHRSGAASAAANRD